MSAVNTPVMPDTFRHPPFRKLDSREFAGPWTPEQVRGDGGRRQPRFSAKNFAVRSSASFAAASDRRSPNSVAKP